MDISKRYSIELNKINNHLADLERGHIYELTQTPGTPSCATLAQHLKGDITALLDLIENDKPGVAEKLLRHSKTYSPATICRNLLSISSKLNTTHASAYNNQERKCSP